MSSRYDNRRRDRSRDRGGRYVDRDAPGRRSRSRSPPRRGEREPAGRGPADRREFDRDYRRDRDYDRRRDDRDRDLDRNRDRDRDAGRDRERDRGGRDFRDRDRERPRDERTREPPRRDGDKERDRDPVRERSAPRGVERPHDDSARGTPRTDDKRPAAVDGKASGSPGESLTNSRDISETPMDEREEGEEMDATNEDDAAMMAMMGIGGFGTTKGRHVEGNQEGSVDVKKMRTWRQYMNRRGGFNRPLDKIK